MFTSKQKISEILADKDISVIKDLLFPKCFDWINDDNINSEVLTKTFRGAGRYEKHFDFLKEHISNGSVKRFQLYSKEEIEVDSSKNVVETLAYINSNSNKVAVIIPGGGYSNVCSYSEGFPVADELYNKGYNCFVLYYRVYPNSQMPKPIEDLSSLIKFIIKNYPSLDINSYLLIGFSAGGHLAGIWSSKVGNKKYRLPSPKYLVLCYPVTDLSLKCSTKNNCLIGDESEFILNYSPIYNVDFDYPITYLWQGEFDDVIPFSHSVNMDKVLTEKSIKHKFVTYKDTCHGFSLGYDTVAEGWIDEMLSFFNKN